MLADDSVILREGLARLLAEQEIEVCAAVGDASAAVASIGAEQPDVAILDIRMPPSFTDEGLRAAEEARSRFPDVGVLVLSQYVEADYALRLLDGGRERCGYLLKDRVTDIDELLEALRRVAAGDTVVDRELVSILMARRSDRVPLDELSPRELEVLALMAQGLTDRGIAVRLWLTPRTVETHVRHILRKLDLPADTAYNRRVQAVITFLRSA